VTEVTPPLTRPPRGNRPLCADVSRAHAEPLGATASRVDHWLLVEYRHLWSRDPVAGSGLPDEAKAHLRRQLRALPNARLLFVRRPGRDQPESFSVFFGRSLESERRFFRAEIASYGDLPGLDFAGALVGGAAVGDPLAHPLLVVCTHGKRDRCCAKYGRPLYDEVAAEADPDWVWQSTHVGGDRFAGNLVCLPEGLYFGRVGRPDVWSLLDEYLAGRIDLDRYRGRSCYGFAVQAAERHVREATGRTEVDALRLAHAERTGEHTWTVRFRVEPRDEVHEVDVVGALADEPTHLTCASMSPQRPRRHIASAHRVLTG
jgi:hypothetical protein